MNIKSMLRVNIYQSIHEQIWNEIWDKIDSEMSVKITKKIWLPVHQHELHIKDKILL